MIKQVGHHATAVLNGQRFTVIDINTPDADVRDDLDKVISHDWQAIARLAENKTMRIMIKENDFPWWKKNFGEKGNNG